MALALRGDLKSSRRMAVPVRLPPIQEAARYVRARAGTQTVHEHRVSQG